MLKQLTLISLIFVCRVWVPEYLFAQKADLTSHEIMVHIRTGIVKNFQPDSLSLSKLCRSSSIFIKFSVDKNGLVKNLALSRDSLSFIQDALIKAVKSLEKDLNLMTALKKSGKTIVQPFIYNYLEACELNKYDGTEPFNKQDNNKNKSAAISDSEALFDSDHVKRSLFDMLNFDDKLLTEIDCLLLNPIIVNRGGAMY